MTGQTSPARVAPCKRSLVSDLRDFQRDRLGMLLRLSRECGDIGPVRLGPTSTVAFANSASAAGSVLVEHADDFRKGKSLRAYMRPVIGNGLLSSSGEAHRYQRQLVAPAFRHNRIGAYADVMVSYAERAQQGWRDGEVIDIGPAMTRVTLGIVGKVLFDADMVDEADELGAALTEALRYASSQLASPVHVPLSWPTSRNRRVQRAIARLNRTIYGMIEERRAAAERKEDVLSLLLSARGEDGSRLSNKQVRDEAMTLFIAGHDTVANALAWTWCLLAQHPDAYSRVCTEVDAALAGRTPTVADLPHLPYTLQVFKEALRLYPPAYVLSRQAIRDVDLAGYPVPAWGVVIVSPYTMHRRPDYFPDPERFDPDRFTPDAEARLPRHAYLPFGGGPHICIGNHFALMEGHLILVTLAQHATFEWPNGQRIIPEPLINLRPKRGTMVRVRRRSPMARTGTLMGEQACTQKTI